MTTWYTAKEWKYFIVWEYMNNRNPGEDLVCVFVIQKASHFSSTLHEKQRGGGHPLCPVSHMIQPREWRGWAKHRDEYMERKQRRCSLKARWSNTVQCDTLWDKRLITAGLLCSTAGDIFASYSLSIERHGLWKTRSRGTETMTHRLAHLSQAHLSFTLPCTVVQRSALSHSGDRQVYYLCMSLWTQMVVLFADHEGGGGDYVVLALLI